MVYKIENLSSTELLLIGQHGEHLANTIQLDMTSWLQDWPDATFAIVALRPTDKVPYLVNTIVSGNMLLWQVTKVDTAIVGIGSVEIQAFSGEKRRKSVVIGTKVNHCICNEDITQDPPDAYEVWMEQLAATQADTALKLSQVRAIHTAVNEAAEQALINMQNELKLAGEAVAEAEYWASEAQAAGAWHTATATAETLPPGSQATVVVQTTPEGKKVLHFGVPEGAAAAAFYIVREYSTMKEFEAAVDNGTLVGGPGYASLIGTTDDYVIMLWITATQQWLNIGSLRGPAFTYNDFTPEQLEALKGQNGATFVPYVSPEGLLTWANNKDLPNPTPINLMGPEGPKGDDFVILGVYASYEELVAQVTDPVQGAHYDVGVEPPYTMYMWDAAHGWVLKGALGAGGTGVPDGGSAGQTLVKQSNEDGDAEWADMDLVNIAYSDAENEGIDEDGNILIVKTDDSDKLGGKPPEYYLQSVECLDNCELLIAQAGRPAKDSDGKWISGLHGEFPYAADRWYLQDADFSRNGNVNTLSSSGGYGFMQQAVNEEFRPLSGEAVTVAIKLSDGTVKVANAIVPENVTGSTAYLVNLSLGSGCGVLLIKTTAQKFFVRPFVDQGSSISFEWIRLLSGTYTVETFPPYIPKGYGAELAECQRYYRRSWTGTMGSVGTVGFVRNSADTSMPVVHWEKPMRGNPTVTLYSWQGGAGHIRDWSLSTDVAKDVVSPYATSPHGFSINGLTNITAGHTYAFHYVAAADL